MSVNVVEVVDPQAAATTGSKKTADGEDEGVKGKGGVCMGKRRSADGVARTAATHVSRPRAFSPRRRSRRSASPSPMRPFFLSARALSSIPSYTPRIPPFALLNRSPFLTFRRTMAAHATVDTSARLAALRALMAKPEHNVQAVVIPTEDQRKSISPRRTLFYTCDTA